MRRKSVFIKRLHSIDKIRAAYYFVVPVPRGSETQPDNNNEQEI